MKINFAYKNILKSACLIVGLAICGFSNATIITADISRGVQPNYYEFQYNIINDGPTDPIDGLIFYFDYGLFQNISLVNTPSNWDFFSAEPEFIFGIEESGFVDGLALFDPLTIGQELNSLIVSFEWLGTTDIASYVQPYDVYDAVTFDFIADGITALSVSQVPEPSTMGILALALVILFSISLKRRQGVCDAN